MGYYKQLHIDCSEGECLANDWETCYMQPSNPSYSGDYDPLIDQQDTGAKSS